MGKITNFKRGNGFEIMPEGEQDILIKTVEVLPPVGEPKKVTIKCVNRDGIKWNNSYDFTRSPKAIQALYVLVTKGCGIEVGDDGFDPEEMEGYAFTAEIVHNVSTNGNTFANLGKIVGPCAPWEEGNVKSEPTDFDDDEDLF